MKLIFSRKGMDSSFGAVPSPILPDGRLCWLPIPESTPFKPNLPTYHHLQSSGHVVGDLVESLSRGKLSGQTTIHLDPDLDASLRQRTAGWRPTFGQTGAAERHLLNNGVGPGDIFVFFGWFRQATMEGSRWKYLPGSPDMHVIYGWLQIGQRVPVDIFASWPEWLVDHPHVIGSPYGDLDSIYMANDSSLVESLGVDVRSAGVFDRINESLILTRPGMSRSNWRLPPDFFPGTRDPLSYHSDPARWTMDGNEAGLRLASRGQEFVLDLEQYPGVQQWLASSVFEHNITNIRR